MVHKLTKIVIKHGGQLVSSEDAATHVVDWNDELDLNYLLKEKNESTTKMLSYYSRDVPDDHFIVHTIYYPDSYNEVIPVKGQLGYPNSDPVFCAGEQSLKKKYYLSCRYLLDCESFNEWGHELDYEISTVLQNEDEDITQSNFSESLSSTGNRGRGRGKKRNSSAYSIQTKMIRETFIPQMTSSVEKFSFEVPASFHRLWKSSLVSMDMSDSNRIQCLSLQQMSDPSFFVSSSLDGEAKSEETDLRFFKKPKINLDIGHIVLGGRVVDKLDERTISSPFSLDSISDLERKYLHYLLCFSPLGSVADVETNYVQIRNAIVNLYLLNKNQYLTGTECRRKIAGDISTILRIHEFLDAFGMINNAVKLESCPRYLMEDFNHLTVKRQLIQREMLEKCTSIYAKGSIFSGNDRSHDFSSWSDSTDHLLLCSVVEGNYDWQGIATMINELLQKENQDISASALKTVTSFDCMLRLLELSLFSCKGTREDSHDLRSVVPVDDGQQFPDCRYMQPGKQWSVFKAKSIVHYFTMIQKEMTNLTTLVSCLLRIPSLFYNFVLVRKQNSVLLVCRRLPD
jgi:hypothetical protein